MWMLRVLRSFGKNFRCNQSSPWGELILAVRRKIRTKTKYQHKYKLRLKSLNQRKYRQKYKVELKSLNHSWVFALDISGVKGEIWTSSSNKFTRKTSNPFQSTLRCEEKIPVYLGCRDTEQSFMDRNEVRTIPDYKMKLQILSRGNKKESEKKSFQSSKINFSRFYIDSRFRLQK